MILITYLVERVASVADVVIGEHDLHDLVSQGIEDVLVSGLARGVCFICSLCVLLVLLVVIVILLVIRASLCGIGDTTRLGLRELRENSLCERYQRRTHTERVHSP